MNGYVWSWLCIVPYEIYDLGCYPGDYPGYSEFLGDYSGYPDDYLDNPGDYHEHPRLPKRL